jgi:macrolide transport system ATP-binding/permease protein
MLLSGVWPGSQFQVSQKRAYSGKNRLPVIWWLSLIARFKSVVASKLYEGVVWMLLFSANDLAQTFDGREIFHDVRMEVALSEKVGLVGANGIGKSSLLRIIAAVQPATAGNIRFYRPVKTALLTEQMDRLGQDTVADYLQTALRLNNAAVAYGEVAKKFGFTQGDCSQLVTLSGGEKTRLQLARIWLAQPDLLLMDEPTNHLDSDHLDWLEQFIRQFSGTVLVVSHDRYFLDRSVTRVLELQATGITSYPGNYSDYARAKQLQFEQDLKTYFDQERRAQKLQRAIAAQEAWSDRGQRESRRKARAEGPTMGLKEFYRAKAKKLAKQVKNNVKRLRRMEAERVAKPRAAETVGFSFNDSQRRGNCLLNGEGISKSFGTLRLLQQVKLAINAGEKVGLIGPNGAGKTTLVKILLGDVMPDSGTLWFSPALKVGYLDQELLGLDDTKTVWEEVATANHDPKLIRNLLAGLLFRGEAVCKRCAVLSKGERVRIGLAKLMLGDCNLIILDEPTNYLDLPSRERLEETLQNYRGALLVVSHDRYLLQRVSTTIWSIAGQTVHTYPGNYTEYLASLASVTKGERCERKLQLELQKAQLLGELATVDRQRASEEYRRLEAEFEEIVRQLRDDNSVC